MSRMCAAESVHVRVMPRLPDAESDAKDGRDGKDAKDGCPGVLVRTPFVSLVQIEQTKYIERFVSKPQRPWL